MSDSLRDPLILSDHVVLVLTPKTKLRSKTKLSYTLYLRYVRTLDPALWQCLVLKSHWNGIYIQGEIHMEHVSPELAVSVEEAVIYFLCLGFKWSRGNCIGPVYCSIHGNDVWSLNASVDWRLILIPGVNTPKGNTAKGPYWCAVT